MRALTTLVFWLVIAGPALAGRDCEQRAPTLEAVLMAEQASSALHDVLEGSGAELAIVGRVGSDVSKYGLRYTHAGIAVRQHPKGRWLVRHMLNHCGRPTSSLFDQGLTVFFLDDPFAYDALVLIPTPAEQAQLREIVLSETALALHEPAYSTLAYPFSERYQNSNQWLLELLALSASGGPLHRRQAQLHLRNSGYRASTVQLPALQRLGAALFKANVRFDDHPISERLSGRYSVVTVKSIEAYLQRTGLLDRRIVVTAPPVIAASDSRRLPSLASQGAGDQAARHRFDFVQRDQP